MEGARTQELVPSYEDCLEYYKVNLQKIITSFKNGNGVENSCDWMDVQEFGWTNYDIMFTEFLGSLTEFQYENTLMWYHQMQKWCLMMAQFKTPESRLKTVN
jgi:hypothetical protein